MPATTPEPATAQQLEEALADLKAALARASDATARLKALLPEIVSAGSVLDQNREPGRERRPAANAHRRAAPGRARKCGRA